MKREQRAYIFSNEEHPQNKPIKYQIADIVLGEGNQLPSRLSGEYTHGYRKAIMDVMEVFSYIEPDLRHHHKGMTFKTAQKLLECILDNREKLRDNWRGFIRFNCVKNEFEWFRGKDK